MAGGQQQQSIDLSVLSLEQLNQMKTQHEEEVQTLSGNFVKLRDAQVCHTEYHTMYHKFFVTSNWIVSGRRNVYGIILPHR